MKKNLLLLSIPLVVGVITTGVRKIEKLPHSTGNIKCSSLYLSPRHVVKILIYASAGTPRLETLYVGVPANVFTIFEN